MIEALTDELLANAERLYLMALAREAMTTGVYHGQSGVSAGLEQGLSMEEKNWPT
jgi:hypothetical protein